MPTLEELETSEKDEPLPQGKEERKDALDRMWAERQRNGLE
jgi:hypothetical protein